MPVVTVYGLPDEVDQKELLDFCELIKAQIVADDRLGLIMGEVSVFFPNDRLKDGLGEEVIILIQGLFDKPDRTDEVRSGIARRVGEAVKEIFSDSLVEIFIQPFNPSWGFWSSNNTS